jgi:hypothetical protein
MLNRQAVLHELCQDFSDGGGERLAGLGSSEASISGLGLMSVGIATGYGLHNLGSVPGSARYFSTPQRPDWL